MSNHQLSNFIQQAIKDNLIRFYDDYKRIEYVLESKSRLYTNPEEQVQAETYCQLIYKYNYNPKRIKNYVTVTMGSERKEADIVVYNDDECKQPHILVECKQPEVSEAELNRAVDQAYSYAFALPNNVKWVWVTSKIKSTYFQVDKSKKEYIPASDIPSYGVNELAPYKFVKGGGEVASKNSKQQFFDLITISEDELTKRFKQAHNALWAGGQLNPSEAFDELDKLIFCKIWDERKARKKGEPYDFQIIQEKDQAETNQALFKRVNKLYEEGRKQDPEVFKDNIRLTPERVRMIVGYLQDINLSKTDLDSKGRAFEVFMDSFFRGNFGQYFTPRPIVKFIVDVLPITNTSLVLDTSCGSGGFLLHALEKVRREADQYYDQDTTEHWRHWHDFAEKRLYGIEINEQISRVAKMNMIIHDDGHTNVITSDGLLDDKTLQQKSKNNGFKYNHFDFIITNPPFGSTVKQTEQAYLKNYSFAKKDLSWLDIKWLDTTNTKVKNRDSQSTEVMFIEQCYYFLKPGGYLAVVIPDGILTNSSLQYVRDQIEDWYRIVAVVSLPQTAFTATGAGVKSSVLFLRKYAERTTEKRQQQKKSIQTHLLTENQYREAVACIEKEKKQMLDNAIGLSYEGKLADFKKTETYKEWRKEKTAEFVEQINSIKEQLEEYYLIERQNKLPDYSIFMAIAEDIGYDATGKPTSNNELDIIGLELKRFIEEVVQNESV